MSSFSTHVLDASRGAPAAGVGVSLAVREADGSWRIFASGATDAAGRWHPVLPELPKMPAGSYKLIFDTAAYFHERGVDSFFPSVEIDFTIRDTTQHYHVPLLLAPYSYSTYRGS